MVSATAELAVGGGLKQSTSTSPGMVDELVAEARRAQALYEDFTQQ